MKCTKAPVRLHWMALAAASLLACAATPAFAAHVGGIDGNFGLGGVVINDFFGAHEQVFAVAPMRDGAHKDFFIGRWLPNGAVDTAFGDQGRFDGPAF